MTTTSEISTESRIDAGDIDTLYHEAGTGSPVVLLHGSGPGVSAWANWQHTIPALSHEFRVLAPDIVGYGATSRPEHIRYSLQTWTDHVVAFLDAAGIEKTAIIGNSLGGRIALAIAEQHPDRVSRMVLMGSPGVGMQVTDGLKALRSYEPSLENMRRLLLDYFAVDPAIITDELVQIRYEASAETFEAYRAMFFDPKHAGNELGITAEQASRITVPSLLVHGREDKVVPLDVAQQMVRVLPNADLHVFAHCGHWTQIERAADFNEIVAQFLRG